MSQDAPARPAARALPILAVLALFSGMALAQQVPAATPADLPVTRLVLFTNGVGYFEHEGTVVGDQVLTLDVPKDAMDDLLQSLVLQDLDGGSVRPVRYTAQDPLQRVLDSYQIDVSSNLNVADVLAQTRGAKVTLVGGRTLTGTVVGVEREQVPEQAPRTFLTLATSTGLVRVALDEFEEVRFDDPRLKAQLDEALAAIAAHAGEDVSKVTISFEGEGTRRVRVAYLREMPVWKSTYRLVVGDDGKGTLQGWAILDNPTDVRLEDVKVSFVAGQPISFVTSLFEPIYVTRPRVETERAGNVVAQVDAGAMPYAPAPAPAMAARGVADMAMESKAAPDLTGAGVTAMATGSRGGASFSYDVSQPVTVGPYESAMVPIVVTDVGATPLTVFNQSVIPDHPLRAVRLSNDTGLHLAAGTVTVYDSNGFAGTAQMSDLVPNDSRILQYAVDLDLTLLRTTGDATDRVVSVKLAGGLVETTVATRQTTKVAIKSTTTEPRFLVVELPRPAGYDVVSPTPPPAITGANYRFGVAINGGTDPELLAQLSCNAGEECTLEVVLERTDLRTTSLANVNVDTLAFYLENVRLSDADRAVIQQVVDLQRQVSAKQRELDTTTRSIDTIHNEQDRIRQNMAALDRNSALYRRYVSDLTDQEDQLADLLERVGQLRGELSSLQQRIADLIAGLGG
ncbi:MAG: hypothetical protein WC972_02835 [Trueperaceae bacterium]|nr:hypothetical protein [Truepera sp.]HRQ11074.1 hypothetical protein [Trueperaceae bacterium]